ncbi:MAG TPA: LON peptidase substrate-binding domain-containing protein [Ktedonobacteraceae bacterium]|nr:LON peptidase substrate-binding domain-containing protein [Ktedonobacteraceae bacterium]
MAIELPLFPLDVVLFPGEDLPLHIFEPRYRLMMNECFEQLKPFGIVLVRPGSEHLKEEPYSVGTMAKIELLDRLEDGRMNLIAKGLQRFSILELHRQKPYLSGLVEVYEDSVEQDQKQTAFARQARQLFNAYLQVLVKVIGKEDVEFNIPTAPEDLSHFIAYFLDVSNERKQQLLELTSTTQRLENEIDILRHEIPFMRQMLSFNNTFDPESPDRSMLN